MRCMGIASLSIQTIDDFTMSRKVCTVCNFEGKNRRNMKSSKKMCRMTRPPKLQHSICQYVQLPVRCVSFSHQKSTRNSYGVVQFESTISYSFAYNFCISDDFLARFSRSCEQINCLPNCILRFHHHIYIYMVHNEYKFCTHRTHTSLNTINILPVMFETALRQHHDMHICFRAASLLYDLTAICISFN